MTPKHVAQYNQMKRWLYRVSHSNEGVYNGVLPLSIYKSDMGYAFFSACWHMWEWIKHDETLDESVRKSAYQFAKNSELLSVCESVCVASKHAFIENEKVRKDAGLLIFGFLHNPLGPEASFTAIELIVRVGDKKYNFADFANKCIQEWNKFFNERGVPLPKEDHNFYFDSLN